MHCSNINAGWSNYSEIVKRLSIGQSAAKHPSNRMKVHRLSREGVHFYLHICANKFGNDRNISYLYIENKDFIIF